MPFDGTGKTEQDVSDLASAALDDAAFTIEALERRIAELQAQLRAAGPPYSPACPECHKYIGKCPHCQRDLAAEANAKLRSQADPNHRNPLPTMATNPESE